MSHIPTQLSDIHEKIRSTCSRVGRDPSEVSLVAVSKTFPAESIAEAFESGQLLFGESRIQEAAPKVEVLPSGIEWHFIGGIQRNKVRKILPHFPFVHAVDSIKLAKYIDSVAEDLGLRPKLFLQVNQAGEASKGGFDERTLMEELPAINMLKHIEVVGLMTIPPAVEKAEESRKWFIGMRRLRDEVEERFSMEMPFLSMGMSGDFEIAIEEGATHVRVGSAIFGKREYKVEGELG